MAYALMPVCGAQAARTSSERLLRVTGASFKPSYARMLRTRLTQRGQISSDAQHAVDPSPGNTSKPSRNKAYGALFCVSHLTMHQHDETHQEQRCKASHLVPKPSVSPLRSRYCHSSTLALFELCPMLLKQHSEGTEYDTVLTPFQVHRNLSPGVLNFLKRGSMRWEALAECVFSRHSTST